MGKATSRFMGRLVEMGSRYVGINRALAQLKEEKEGNSKLGVLGLRDVLKQVLVDNIEMDDDGNYVTIAGPYSFVNRRKRSVSYKDNFKEILESAGIWEDCLEPVFSEKALRGLIEAGIVPASILKDIMEADFSYSLEVKELSDLPKKTLKDLHDSGKLSDEDYDKAENARAEKAKAKRAK